MINVNRYFVLKILCCVVLIGCKTTAPTTLHQASKTTSVAVVDTTAEKMLAYQTSIGGWMKAIDNQKVDYKKKLTEAQKRLLKNTIQDKWATIDNDATTREIRYLVSTAYKNTQNSAYLQAAENGISYLLKMQYNNGGFPQYYPDSSSYRAQVTFNDNAIIRALTIFKYMVEGTNSFDKVDTNLVAKAKLGLERGIMCILATQIKIDGKLTAWAQQYDHRTLLPATARTFEPPGNTSMESVEIIKFLMSLPSPTQDIKNAIEGAVTWLESAKIVGKNVKATEDLSQPTKKDRVLYDDPNSTIWARFYDFDTNKPFFCGRNGVKHANLVEIENERRTGYAWYGDWGNELLTKHYPRWKAKHR